MVISVVKTLCIFDGKALGMGLVWKVMYNIEQHVYQFPLAPVSLSLDLAK